MVQIPTFFFGIFVPTFLFMFVRACAFCGFCRACVPARIYMHAVVSDGNPGWLLVCIVIVCVHAFNCLWASLVPRNMQSYEDTEGAKSHYANLHGDIVNGKNRKEGRMNDEWRDCRRHLVHLGQCLIWPCNKCNYKPINMIFYSLPKHRRGEYNVSGWISIHAQENFRMLCCYCREVNGE